MTRHRWSLALLVPVLGGLLSGCVVFAPGGLGVGQSDEIGDLRWTVTLCASATDPGACTDRGASNATAVPGTGQVLVGVRASSRLPLPETLTSSSPVSLAFRRSPSYTSELERLAPASDGVRWQGYISDVFTYASDGPQRTTVEILHVLAPDPSGSPMSGVAETEIVLGGRMVTGDAPGDRPVVCGSALGTAVDEDPSPQAVYGICGDAATATATFVPRGAGILQSAAGTNAAPGTVVGVPFTLRYTGAPAPAVNFSLTASSALPGAVVAVTPATLTPVGAGDTPVVVAVAVPADAPAGTYGVTLTASLANGQVRTGTGTVTVVRPAPAPVVTTAPLAQRITAVLPRRLALTTARASGIPVQVRATRTGVVRVLLFRGKANKATVTRRVRVKVTGPTRVVLRSRSLRTGAYRVVIRLDGRDVVRRVIVLR